MYLYFKYTSVMKTINLDLNKLTYTKSRLTYITVRKLTKIYLNCKIYNMRITCFWIHVKPHEFKEFKFVNQLIHNLDYQHNVGWIVYKFKYKALDLIKLKVNFGGLSLNIMYYKVKTYSNKQFTGYSRFRVTLEPHFYWIIWVSNQYKLTYGSRSFDLMQL